MCGSYEDGKIQGLGRTLHENGDIYDGFFRRDQMEGQGIYYTYSSNSYIYAYFKRNDCIKILNAGKEYPTQLIKKMKQKIHEKSIEYLDGLMNFKGIGINIIMIIKQLLEEKIFAQKRQKNQYFDISRCDAVEDEEQILKKQDFIRQEQSSRASYGNSANESSMSNAVGSKLQIYNQSINKINFAIPFLGLNHQNENNRSFNDIYEQERTSQNLNQSIRNKTPRQKIFTQENRSRSPYLENNQQSSIKKETISQSHRTDQSKDRLGIQNLSDRSQANPKQSLQEIQNIQNNSTNQGKSQISERNVNKTNLVQNNFQYNQHKIQVESRSPQKITQSCQPYQHNRNISNGQSTEVTNQTQIFSPDRNSLSRSMNFNQPQKFIQQHQNNDDNSFRIQQRELSFSPVRSKSSNGICFKPNANDIKNQRLSPSKISRTEISPKNPSHQKNSENKTRKYQPIFQDTNSSFSRLSTARQIQNSSFNQTYQLDEQSASDKAFKQQNLSPVKSKKLVLCSHREKSVPILNNKIETPKLNTQLFFERGQQSTKNNDNKNQMNEQQQYNQKLKDQINQSKYYSPSFNPSSLTLGDLIKSSQQNSGMQNLPKRNSPNKNTNPKNNNKFVNSYNQENRPNYSEYGLNSQRLNIMTGQSHQNLQFIREQSPSSPQKSQKSKAFEDIALPVKRSQNLNLNDTFQEQFHQDCIISESNLKIQNKDNHGIVIFPSQLYQ